MHRPGPHCRITTMHCSCGLGYQFCVPHARACDTVKLRAHIDVEHFHPPTGPRWQGVK